MADYREYNFYGVSFNCNDNMKTMAVKRGDTVEAFQFSSDYEYRHTLRLLEIVANQDLGGKLGKM